MDIPINADVFCQGEGCGRTMAIILNPVTDVITHIAVKDKGKPNTPRLVPINLILESTPHAVHLKCDVTRLQNLKSFDDVEYIQSVIPRYEAVYSSYYMEPIVIPERTTVTVKHSHIPPYEMSVSRGARVYASNEHPIGRVDEFMVNQESGHITHLILREGHLWGQKDVSIPVSEIERMEDQQVYLKLDKKQIGELPTIPVQRKWA